MTEKTKQNDTNEEKENNKTGVEEQFKGIVSRDFGGLQMILINRIGVPDVPLEVYSFLNFCFHIVI